MSGDLALFNRQRTRAINLRLLRRVIRKILDEGNYDLAVHIVNAEMMARLNRIHLRHAGSTDVITLDYREGGGWLMGEIFVCVDEAVAQSAVYRTTWQQELARYVVHGVLHLRGYDDRRARARARMKRREDLLVAELARRFDLSKLGAKTRLAR
jgi:probable rRNA maturation factor